jgi:excisionase family DNA binding protein
MTRALDLMEAARVVGCHPVTLRRAIARGELSYFRLFGRIRILSEDLDAFVARTYQRAPRRGSKQEEFVPPERA